MASEEGCREAASVFHFSGRLFQIDAIKRAAYKFTDRCAFEFELHDDEIICTAKPLNDSVAKNLDNFELAFRNEVLDQDLRMQIAAETAPIRNAVLAHVFSNTGLTEVD
jgi:His-Xaa-Ser system protein HxsD